MELKQIQTNTSYKLFLSKIKEQHYYKAYISKSVKKDKTTFTHIIKHYFSIQFLGYENEETLLYKVTTVDRVCVDEHNFPVRKLTKAQRIALKTASINDELLFQVSPTFSIKGISNAAEIRKKWEKIAPDLMALHPDIKDWIADFDWQLKDEHIQDVYKEDVFFNFLFADIYEQEFNLSKTLDKSLWLNNVVDVYRLPISIERTLKNYNPILNKGEVIFSGYLDTDHPKFPLQKLNVFIGDLVGASGESHQLNFSYEGHYNLKPKEGLIDNGTLTINAIVDGVYENNTTILFKRTNHE